MNSKSKLRRNAVLLILLSAFLLSGCSDSPSGLPTETTVVSTGNVPEDSASDSTDSSVIEPTVTAGSTDGLDLDNVVSVNLTGQGLTISEAGTYLLSGSIGNGQFVIDASKEDHITIILNGVDITCASSAAIYIKQADKVTFVLNDGSVNSLSTTGEFVAIDDSKIDAVLFSKDDLKIEGNGSLIVTSDTGNGITSKDDLKIAGGTYFITASGHALECNDALDITGGNYTLVTGKDGLHAENSEDTTLGTIAISDGNFSINADGDGLDASASIEIIDGHFTIVSGGGSPETVAGDSGQGGFGWGGSAAETTKTANTTSTKGIKAGGALTLSGSIFTIDSADDAVHSNAELTVDGGSFSVKTGDDGFHADTTLTINGGTIDVDRSYEGLEGQNITITGGWTKINASDDGVNVAGVNDSSGFGGFTGRDTFSGSGGVLRITDGILEVVAEGDGIDSNGDIEISGGEVYVSGPESSNNGALDYDGTAVISGGVFYAAGSSGMAQNFGTGSTQASMLVTLSGTAADTVTVTDAQGNEIASFTLDKVFSPDKKFQCLVISTPDLTVGETYTITAGKNQTSITLSSQITGSGSGMFGGGRPGGGR